ncbi:type II toxin-antitoxin system VapC family toxin [Deinococcus sp.]|uniref:type II toxin-antitoxin system VapC family toxin n=1 Tax=Deinococcus sp. TaxID=47478 RepID=UPI003B5CB5C7
MLDASALLAYFFSEPGAEVVEAALPAAMHAVNLAEVLSRLAERGTSPQQALDTLAAAGVLQVLRIDAGTVADASAVAHLRPLTKTSGLSLGDRYCLAFAQRLGVPALTADQAWLALSIGVQVECIR